MKRVPYVKRSKRKKVEVRENKVKCNALYTNQAKQIIYFPRIPIFQDPDGLIKENLLPCSENNDALANMWMAMFDVVYGGLEFVSKGKHVELILECKIFLHILPDSKVTSKCLHGPRGSYKCILYDDNVIHILGCNKFTQNAKF